MNAGQYAREHDVLRLLSCFRMSCKYLPDGILSDIGLSKNWVPSKSMVYHNFEFAYENCHLAPVLDTFK